MKYRILDNDGDYMFGKGNQHITYGIHAVAQAIRTRLLLLKGEWWEDLEDGLPLFQDILGRAGTGERLLLVDSIIKERIVKTKNVINIESFSSSYEQRKYSVQAIVNTRFGKLTLNEQDII